MAGLPLHDLSYDDPCCGHDLAAPQGIPPELQQALDQYTREIYELKVSAGLSREVLSAYALKFAQAIGLGYTGKAGYDAFGGVEYDTPDFLKLANLMNQAWQFSAAKNYAQTRELTHLLLDENGKPRSWNDYKRAAEQTNSKYALRYLKPEYDLAHAGAAMAAQWVAIENNKSLLEFDAVMDSQTTAICRPLHKTTLPYDHPFWNTYYPPNHWHCRSTVRQLNGGTTTPEQEIKGADINPMFSTNLGKKGWVFPQDHPYFKDAPQGVIHEGISAQRKSYAVLAGERLKGKSVFVEGIGKVEITKSGIKEILNQPIAEKWFVERNHLVFILDVLLHHIISATEPILSSKGKERALGVKYCYVKFKGLPHLTGVLRFNENKTIQMYSITENKNAN